MVIPVLLGELRLCRPGGVKLPLWLCDENIGVILDADGADVLTVDIDRAREDAAAVEIARWIMTTINASHDAQAAATGYGDTD